MDIQRTCPKLGLVIPVYNEEEVLNKTVQALDPIFNDLIHQNKITPDSFILFVDDGSQDSSWKIIASLHEKNNTRFKGLKLSKNSGHQSALLCGLMSAKEFSDCVISMDVDLQDDIRLMYGFLEAYSEGYDVVYGIRSARDTDTYFKRTTAVLYYRILKKFGVNIKHNHADYRLMSKQALDQLANFSETNIFLRGLVPLIGFPSKEIYYDRQKRAAGVSKYPLKKMLLFAIDGITSFSNLPLRAISLLGFFVFIFSIVMSVYVLFQNLILHNVVRGWASITLSMYALSGIQLLCLGIIGEYIGKIYTETKRRPKYIIEKNLT